jgi:hypothetical protein
MSIRRRARLRQLLRRNFWTAADVAKLLNRRPQTIRAWACGARSIPLEALEQLEVLDRGSPPSQAA